MEKEYLQRMQDFVLKAGKFALEKQDHLKNLSLKADNSLVTETDLAVSKMMQDDFADILKSPEHMLIDEESVSTVGAPPKEAFKHKYLWVLDPIDGTAPYGAGMPMFGISLGLIKDKKLHMGVIYLPYFDELYVCDGKQSYLIKKGKKEILKIETKPLKPTDIFVFDPKLFNWQGSTYTGYTNTSVVGLSWLSSGKYIGQCNHDSFWDVAAGWPLCLQAGLTIYNKKTQTEIHDITELFDDNWHLKQPVITCHQDHYDTFKNALKAK